MLSLEALAATMRYTRSAMLEVLRRTSSPPPAPRACRARLVTLRHAFRNALLPVITVVSLRVPVLLGGAVVIESMFQWPGMGTLAILSIQQRDYPVLMGLTLMTAALVLLSNLVADVLYAYADPRIRYSLSMRHRHRRRRPAPRLPPARPASAREQHRVAPLPRATEWPSSALLSCCSWCVLAVAAPLVARDPYAVDLDAIKKAAERAALAGHRLRRPRRLVARGHTAAACR